jgi:hypothetical protein
VFDRTKPDEPAKPVTPAGERYADLSFASTGRNVLAMTKITEGATPEEPATSDLCLARLEGDRLEPNCKVEPEINVEREVNWSLNGKELLGFGFRAGTTEFGVVQWRTKKPFSTNPEDWSPGRIRTDTSRPGQGVLAAAVSPDGKRMAVARIGNSGRPEVVMAKRGDFPLADAKRLGVIGCKVLWRPDGERLVVVQSDDCNAATGELVQFPVDDPQSLRSLNLSGDNPVFQPLSTAG